MQKVEFYPIKEIPDNKLLFAVVMARTTCGWLFARHRDRLTWDMPGGHREESEPIWNTASRELYEETGAIASMIVPVSAYSVDDGEKLTYGAIFFAEVKCIEALPNSEMAEVQCCKKMPEELTYPEIQPLLFNAGMEFALSWDYTMSDVF